MDALLFAPQVDIFLETLEEYLRKRILTKMFIAKEFPCHYFERLHGQKVYKLRDGDYRIIADIDIPNRVWDRIVLDLPVDVMP